MIKRSMINIPKNGRIRLLTAVRGSFEIELETIRHIPIGGHRSGVILNRRGVLFAGERGASAATHQNKERGKNQRITDQVSAVIPSH